MTAVGFNRVRMSRPQPLYLCAGLQSSGSTVVSWCFLQRADMDGVFDARNDILPDIPAVSAPRVWCKITISSFRFSEMKAHYEDEGWTVHPLLVVRDVRAVFNSLLKKHYGSNGITAEEPPLRMRMRRFKEDWELFRANNWPTIRYETLVVEPEATLRKACNEMGLDWDEGMMSWPKPKDRIAAPRHGSPTFRQSLGGSFNETVKPSLAELRVGNVPPDDLEWIEREFEEFNRASGYVEHAAPAPSTAGREPREPRAVPKWENTRRHRKSQRPFTKFQAAVSKIASNMKGAVSGKKPADASGDRE
jgi:hypothetical protein